MRYVYSIVRFVPKPFNGERVNIGMVVGSEESGLWQLRRVQNLERARQLDGARVLVRLSAFLDEMSESFDRYSRMFSSSAQATLLGLDVYDEAWLENLRSRQRGIVQFSSPFGIEADTPDEVFNLLWDRFIIEEEPTTRPRAEGKSNATNAMRDALRSARVGDDRVWSSPRLVVGDFSAPVDLAVHNGTVANLTQCWSFRVSDKNRVLSQVKSWAWTARHLRMSGGDLRGDSERARVRSDVRLTVVTVPPNDTEGEQAYAESIRVFEHSDVKVDDIVETTNRIELNATARQIAALVNSGRLPVAVDPPVELDGDD